ncbi:MAG TPA: carbamoyltransferase C-terminal domain-containing protein [Stellaceae bacterium]
MLILSLHSGPHDSAAALFDDYRILAAVAEERLNRKKGAGGFPAQAIPEVLRIAGVDRRQVDVAVCTRSYYARHYFTHWRPHERLREELRRLAGRPKTIEVGKVLYTARRRDPNHTPDRFFNRRAFLRDLGLRPDASLFFSNHHFSHALPSLFFTDWEEALLYTADGNGDHVFYSHYLFKDGQLANLYGDDRWLGRAHPSGSLALAYGNVTDALGFRSNRHEGKLTGLAAYGQPTLLPEMQRHFTVTEDGRIEMDFADIFAMRDHFVELAQSETRENAAASVQALLEWGISESLRRLLARHPVRRLGVAGGAFANVRLNRLLAETLPIDEIFITPPMGDEGLVIGSALQFLLERDGLPAWLKQRRRLADVCWGGAHDGDLARIFTAAGARRHDGDPAALTAARLAEGGIGALYDGRMEFGPRALGSRSILANPADAAVNDALNRRLERSDFMPFAPVVGEGDAAEVFDIGPVNRYAARFMTICCAVRESWRPRIPAVVHIDGSARPQIIRRADQPFYFDILAAFKALTGLPVLINTSFNVHEEPIVNRPEECLRALLDGRVDFVATAEAVWTRA